MDESPPIPDPIRQPVRSWLLGIARRPARILDRLVGGGHAVEDELVDLALLLGLHPVVGIEGAVGAVAALHLAGIGRGARRVEPRDRPRAGLPGQKPRPGFLDTRRQRGHKPQPRHNHSPHVPAPSSGPITSRPDSAKGSVWAIPPPRGLPPTSPRQGSGRYPRSAPAHAAPRYRPRNGRRSAPRPGCRTPRQSQGPARPLAVIRCRVAHQNPTAMRLDGRARQALNSSNASASCTRICAIR
jgi:hypothetical protein